MATFSQAQTEVNVTGVCHSVRFDKLVEFVLFLHMLLGIKYST